MHQSCLLCAAPTGMKLQVIALSCDISYSILGILSDIVPGVWCMSSKDIPATDLEGRLSFLGL
eukprot:6183836-Pleurochrysis_carterae.AAC.1